MLQRLLGVRRVMALVIGVPCLLFTAAGLGYQAMFGEGTLVFVAPAEGSLEVLVDDQAHQVAGGAHEKVKVKQGKHGLKLTSEAGVSARTVEVKSGFAELLVPVTATQCFGLFDVSKSHFTYGSKSADKYPKLVHRVVGGEVYDLPGSTWFSEAELPTELKEGHSCNLLLEVDCALLKLPDAELFRTLFE